MNLATRAHFRLWFNVVAHHMDWSPPHLSTGWTQIGTYTLAWGFFFEKSQARPRSEMRTWPCSSSRILAGCGCTQAERERGEDRSSGRRVGGAQQFTSFRPTTESSAWIQTQYNLLSWLSSTVWQNSDSLALTQPQSIICIVLLCLLKLWKCSLTSSKICLLLWQPIQTGDLEEKQKTEKYGWYESAAVQQLLRRCGRISDWDKQHRSVVWTCIACHLSLIKLYYVPKYLLINLYCSCPHPICSSMAQRTTHR